MRPLSFRSLALLLTLSLFFSQLTFSQDEKCGFDDYHAKMLKEDAQYSQSLKEYTASYLKAVRKGEITPETKGNVITIPIVFHVIHLGEAEGVETNISLEQIQSSVDGMNIQYRNTNPDGTPYVAEGTDLEFEFCMAKRDPDGNPTEGVTRHDGRTEFGSIGYETTGFNQGSVDNAIKPATTWDRTKYYNVWVAAKIKGENPYGGGTKGYATFAGGSAAMDGTVVVFNSCGFDPDGSRGFNLFGSGDNGTMVHEVGHAFNLYHTFNNGGSSPGAGCPPVESDCSQDGDQVCDTKPHEGDLGRCRNIGDPTCQGDVYDINITNNFMNYTNCTPALYTPGQRDRVHFTLQNQRAYFNNPGTPNVCVPVFEYDAAITEQIAPSGFFCDANVTPVIALKNNGQNTITSVDIEYGVNGNVLNTFTWTGSLAQLSTVNVTLPDISVSVATHNFFARVKQNTINGSQPDEYSSNDQVSGDFEIINGNVLTLTVSSQAEGDKVEIVDSGSGAVIFSTNFSGQPDPFTRDICLPDGCYKVNYIDQVLDHPFFGGKQITYTLKNDVGYSLASGVNFPNYSGGTYTDESDEFCLPFDPGFMQADFKANQTLVEVGTLIQFTDLSENNAGEQGNYWRWRFGDGGQSTAQNPTYTYNASGVYTVELIVDNDVNFPDTATKIHYIRVFDPITGCDEFNNLIAGESGTTYNTVEGAAGYFPGTASGISAFAERFLASKKSFIDFVEFDVNQLSGNSATQELVINIYNEASDKPNQAIGSQRVDFADLIVGNNQIIFDNPVEVDGKFFVAFSTESGLDTIAITTAPYRAVGDFSNTAYVRKNGTWEYANVAITEAEATSLDVTVKLSYVPEANIDNPASSVCQGVDVTFDGGTSVNPDTYEWTTAEGFPSLGTNETFTTNFSTPGTKEVVLVVTAGCNKSDTARFFIEVSGSPTATIETVDDVCAAGNGEASITIDGGSGSYNYTWNTATPTPHGNKVTGLVGGTTYTMTWEDPTCNVAPQTESFTIGNVTQLPSFDVEIEHTTCGGNNGSAIAYPTGGVGGYIFEWSSDVDPSFTANVAGLFTLAPATYTITVGNNNCDPRSETFTINKTDSLIVSVSEDKVEICEGDTALLVAMGADSIRWLNTNDGMEYFTDSLSMSPSQSTKFNIYFVDDRDCKRTLTSEISVIETPNVFARASAQNGVTYSFDTAYVDLAKGSGWVYFSSAASDAFDLQWDFGDGEISTRKNPEHEYLNSGTYTVVLFGGSTDCSTTDTVVVEVFGELPVGIGENDVDDFISIYPNPTNGQLTLVIGQGVALNDLTLLDLNGREIQKWSGDINTIDMSANDNGIYILRLNTEDGMVFKRIELLK